MLLNLQEYALWRVPDPLERARRQREQWSRTRTGTSSEQKRTRTASSEGRVKDAGEQSDDKVQVPTLQMKE